MFNHCGGSNETAVTLQDLQIKVGQYDVFKICKVKNTNLHQRLLCMFEIAISLVIELNAIFKNACNLHHIKVEDIFSILLSLIHVY